MPGMHADVVSAAAGVAQAAILIGASAIAFRQVREARGLREDQAKPYVVVSLETDKSSPYVLYLVIRNLGTTAAKDVRITFDPPLSSSLDRPGDNRIAEWSALARGIPTLVPGQSMRTLIDSLTTRYAGDSGSSADVVRATVKYSSERGKPGKPFTYVYDLDFNVFFGSHFTTQKNLGDLVKVVEGIQKTLQTWTADDGARVYVKELDRLLEERHTAWLERVLEREVAAEREREAQA
jgi:hypothetical protein